MKMVGYKCAKCEKLYEDLFNDTEEKPEIHPTMRCECGGRLCKWDVKRNSQRAFVSDSRRA